MVFGGSEMLKIQYNCSKKEADSMIKEVRYVYRKLPSTVQEKIDDQCIIILFGKTLDIVLKNQINMLSF